VTLRFGTDGVRGVANSDLTPELVVALGRAAARTLGAERFVIGRDTRRSGPLLEAALVAGLTAEGVGVATLGVVPTPTVAWTSAAQGVAGAMISASHNPFSDNGIKLFAPGGRKLRDDTEEQLEAELDALVHGAVRADARTGAAVGTVQAEPEHLLGYGSSVVASIDGRDLRGVHVVIDCANGSATTIAAHVLRDLGAEVGVLHGSPDGTNINDHCGSTDPADLQRAVVERGAKAGLAFDGDADRVLAVDEHGELVDGDQIIAICALDRHERRVLVGDAVVVTVMANLGFRNAMAAHGIGVIETAVGDRSVLDALETNGLSLGGEQSGHVIFHELATTGDGLLTGVQLLDVMVRTGRPLSELAGAMTRLPQVLHNVRVSGDASDRVAAIEPAIAAATAELGGGGRVLVRPSGTEPIVRVMVEAPTHDQAERIAHELASALS
jgi:phosphoglucosamine mutase